MARSISLQLGNRRSPDADLSACQKQLPIAFSKSERCFRQRDGRLDLYTIAIRDALLRYLWYVQNCLPVVHDGRGIDEILVHRITNNVSSESLHKNSQLMHCWM